MTRRATDDEKADHERDLRKHDFPPLNRAEQPLDTVEVAIAVKAIPLMQGAELIEQYARTYAAGQKAPDDV